MRSKINGKAIARMQPQTTLWDAEVRGFCARRQLSEVVTYSVIYSNCEGKQRWYKVGRHPIFSPDLARKEAIRVLRDVALGKDPSAERYELRHGMTVAQLLDDYVADMQSGKLNSKKARTIKTDLSRINRHIRPDLGHYKVATITSDQIEHFMNEQSRGSARRIVALTSTIFNWAVKRKLRVDNPCSGIEKPKDIKKVRRLSNDEYMTLHNNLDSINRTVADIIMFLAVTGWRTGEATNLKFSEVDLDRRMATLADTKTGISVRPLSGAACDRIRKRYKDNEYVFTMNHGRPLANLTEQFAKLELPKDVTPHVLRHSFASLAGDLGLPDATIAALIGPKQGTITSRYTHLGDGALLKAADLVSNATIKLMEGRSQTHASAIPAMDARKQA